jgi:hypothetical protein
MTPCSRSVLRDEARRRDPLERVLDVLRRDVAVERWGELDALAKRERVGEAVLGDLGLALGEVRITSLPSAPSMWR